MLPEQSGAVGSKRNSALLFELLLSAFVKSYFYNKTWEKVRYFKTLVSTKYHILVSVWHAPHRGYMGKKQSSGT